jgi:hypothetical protein
MSQTDLVQANVEAIVPRDDNDVEEIVEVDIFANMPGLVSAKDPAQNGTWILAPSKTDTNKRDLQYVYVDERRFKTVPCGDFVEGACLVPGALWRFCRRSLPRSSLGRCYMGLHSVIKFLFGDVGDPSSQPGSDCL